ncbi:MAG: bifunctional heptose 7-phosphate kinase/heptose 1-phosphate adenyltransferase [Candidatus Cyclobacteriaceae bacterium M3_2C_046]
MSYLQEIFHRFDQLKVLIVGDVMIDSYIWGTVERISPEAPVPIVSIKKKETRLGGAANVALNIQAMGATPLLCSVIGHDTDSQEFIKLLQKRNISAKGIIQSEERVTTVKERVLSATQQILRIDREIETDLHEADEKQLQAGFKELLPQCDVVIYQDYDKGCLTSQFIRKSLDLARSAGKPTVVDPKKRHFLDFKDTTLFKPNLKEIKEGLKLDFLSSQTSALEDAVKKLKEVLRPEIALLTLSGQGVFIDGPREKYHLPAHLRNISDVSGAGDTVVSIAALAVALELPLKQIAGLSNLGGGLVCEHLGVVPIDKERLLNEALKHKIWS